MTEWEEAVRRSYRYSVTAEEFELKATPEATRKIAYYMKGLGVEIEYLDDTSDEVENRQVQLLYDFLAFTDVAPIDMDEFLNRR